MAQGDAGPTRRFRRRNRPKQKTSAADARVKQKTSAEDARVNAASPRTPPPAATTPNRRRGKVFRALGLLVLLLLPVVGGVAGYAVALVTPPRYTAEAYVLVTSSGAREVTPGDIAQAVARVATTESVLVAGDSPDLIRAAREDQLTASASPDAPIVELAASAGSAFEAAALANDLAEAVTLHMTANVEVQEVEASTFATASVPADPSSPNVAVNVVAGAALGLLLTIVGFVLRRR